jgi:hypothetical protein
MCKLYRETGSTMTCSTPSYDLFVCGINKIQLKPNLLKRPSKTGKTRACSGPSVCYRLSSIVLVINILKESSLTLKRSSISCLCLLHTNRTFRTCSHSIMGVSYSTVTFWSRKCFPHPLAFQSLYLISSLVLRSNPLNPPLPIFSFMASIATPIAPVKNHDGGIFTVYPICSRISCHTLVKGRTNLKEYPLPNPSVS